METIDYLTDGHVLREEQAAQVDKVTGGKACFHIRVYKGGTLTGVVKTRKEVPANATYTVEFQDGAWVGESFTGAGGEKYVFVHTDGETGSSLGGIPVKMVEVNE